jgi:hypothetical protein
VWGVGGGGGPPGGEMNQALYAHMNKKKKRKETFACEKSVNFNDLIINSKLQLF